MLKILEDLILLARERRKKPIEGSYTNKLLKNKDLAKDKVLEEINELIEAVEENTNKVHEAADVLYHLIVYLEANGVKIEDIMEELTARKKITSKKILIKSNTIQYISEYIYFHKK